jgi:hypothetical protein
MLPSVHDVGRSKNRAGASWRWDIAFELNSAQTKIRREYLAHGQKLVSRISDCSPRAKDSAKSKARREGRASRVWIAHSGGSLNILIVRRFSPVVARKFWALQKVGGSSL